MDWQTIIGPLFRGNSMPDLAIYLDVNGLASG